MVELSPQTIHFIRTHAKDDVRALALQSSKYPDIDIPAAIVQIAGRQAAANKIPSWEGIEEIFYPRHLSLEQCSSELTARYKSTLTQGDSLTDLTGGFGIDCAFMAPGFKDITYIERQKELCEIASHNFPLLNLGHIEVRNIDGVCHLQQMEPVDWIFIDPARRNEHGGKTVAIADCEPDVAQLEELLLSKARKVMVKLSPMLDLSLAIHDLKHVHEAHIVSVNNECKELLLILSQDETVTNPEVRIVCVNLTPQSTQHFTFSRETEQVASCHYTSEIGTYLYEPNASLLKAGAFRSIASAFKVKKLHPNSHLYTSDEKVENFPGRTFQITGCCTFGKKETKAMLSDLKKANLTVRNFPATVAELRKRTKLAEGGEDYLFATTLNDGQKILIRGKRTS